MDRCHLIPAQRVRKELRSRWPRLDAETTLKLVWHDYVWVWGCRHHHNELDISRKLRIPYDELPAKTKAFARLLGLSWSLQRDYLES